MFGMLLRVEWKFLYSGDGFLIMFGRVDIRGDEGKDCGLRDLHDASIC